MAELTEKNTPTRVKVDLGWTRNMGNFESLRVVIGVEDDARGDENVRQAFNRVYAFVENVLMDKVRETEEEVQKITGR